MKKQKLSAIVAPSYRYLERVVLDEDFKPFAKSPLKIKVVVCADGKTVEKIGRKLRVVVERSAYAFVFDAMTNELSPKTGRPRFVADVNYFCVIVFALHNINAENITHESVHAGFSIAKRDVRDPWRRAFSLDEEWVAYPAGIVARKLYEIFRRNGILKDKT